MAKPRKDYKKKYAAAKRKIKLPLLVVVFFVLVRQFALLAIAILFLGLEEIAITNGAIWYFISLVGFILIFACFLDYCIEKLIFRLHHRYEILFTPMLYDQLFRGYGISNTKIGDSVFTRYGILRDIVQLRNSQLQGVHKALLELFSLPFWLVAAFWLDQEAGIIFSVSAIFMLLLLGFILRTSRARQRRAEDVGSATLDKLETIRNAGRTMLAMGLYVHMRQIWVLSRMRELLFHMQQASRMLLFQNLIRFLYFASLALTPVIMSQSLLFQEGLLLAVLWVGFFALRPIMDLNHLLRLWVKAQLQQPKISQRLRPLDKKRDYWAREIKGKIQLQDVKIISPNLIDPVLQIPALTIHAGEVLGVIGNIGSGKSMLCKLLAGIEDYEGSIRVDEVEYSEWDQEFLGSHIGYLPQEIDLLPGTISENICRFTPHAREDDVINVAKLAGADSHIRNLEKSYSTEIAVGNDTVPYGLKQRIAIARALFGMPQIIVLDAVTAQLDQKALLDLRNSIDTLKKLGKTMILVTHSRNFLELADNIAILHNRTLAVCDSADNIIKNM